MLSLFQVDPNLRPHTTCEVMQWLAAVAGFAEPEHAGVAQAYLSTPNLVGRDHALAVVRQRCDRARVGHGGGLILTGAPGAGRSRMLDACVTIAKTLGTTVLRVGVPLGG